jgi:hypothetical protein
MKMYEKVLETLNKEFYDDNYDNFCKECGVKCNTDDDCKANCYNYTLCTLLEQLQREAMNVDGKFNDYD